MPSRFRTAFFPSLLLVGAMILTAGCANVARTIVALDLDLTVTRAGKPVPYQRFVIWIDEKRLEAVTDPSGRIVLTEDYPWDSQILNVPGVGPLRHSPQPPVELHLAADEKHAIDGTRTWLKEPNNAWKLTITVDLPPA